MAQFISLTMRRELFAENSGEVAIALATVTHADLDEPVRLSSDPTERFSVDPLEYGTTSNGERHSFVFMGALIPDDQDGSPRAASLVFEDLSGDIGDVLRGLEGIAEVELALTTSSSPNLIEARFKKLRFRSASGADQRLTIETVRDSGAVEPWPAQRMTKLWFPGLHR